ncbi:hypothetical protein BHM03_00043947 [Ensete ventricosum]|uniref:Uncharacterized protein n=1 Tax=Ensete ventricosum TaxID=4639 RepID=A0A445MKQ8_ENSVE|nr:hypothetical protein BHM03_00043947 [Ensete ventricosum]
MRQRCVPLAVAAPMGATLQGALAAADRHYKGPGRGQLPLQGTWLTATAGAWSWPTAPASGLAMAPFLFPRCLCCENAARTSRTVLHNAISSHAV